MPVTWSISHDDRLVLAAADGDCSLEDLQRYMSALSAAGAMPYRKLFDATYVTSGTLRLDELQALAGMMIAFAKGGPIGPGAIVVGSELEQEMAEVFARVDAGRALAIFKDRSKALAWLDGLV